MCWYSTAFYLITTTTTVAAAATAAATTTTYCYHCYHLNLYDYFFITKLVLNIPD